MSLHRQLSSRTDCCFSLVTGRPPLSLATVATAGDLRSFVCHRLPLQKNSTRYPVHGCTVAVISFYGTSGSISFGYLRFILRSWTNRERYCYRSWRRLSSFGFKFFMFLLWTSFCRNVESSMQDSSSERNLAARGNMEGDTFHVKEQVKEGRLH